MDRFKRITGFQRRALAFLWQRWPRTTFYTLAFMAVAICNSIYDRLVIQPFEPYCERFVGRHIDWNDPEPEGFTKTSSPTSAFRCAIKGKISDEYADSLQEWFNIYDIPYRRQGDGFFFSNVGFDDSYFLSTAYSQALKNLAKSDRSTLIINTDGSSYRVGGIPAYLEAYEKNKPQRIRDMYRKFGSPFVTGHCEPARALILSDWPR
jgi:hypothetical protein